MSELEILRVGAQAVVEDLGRPGWAHLGVTDSGAMDAGALRLANRLLGNDPGCAGIEVLLGGFSVRADSEVRVVVTGAPVTAQVTAEGTPRVGVDAFHQVVTLRPGETVDLGQPRTGLRSYLGVRGGIATEEVLGSRSCDPTSEIAGPALQPGDRLPIGDQIEGAVPPAELVHETEPGEVIELDAIWGPRADWFTERSRSRFTEQLWQVGSDQNRIGVRLSGEPLERRITDELPSEGLLKGSVQVPANGQPLVFGPDHPTTGGYPVICVVTDTDPLAQARPGTSVRFRVRPGDVWDDADSTD